MRPLLNGFVYTSYKKALEYFLGGITLFEASYHMAHSILLRYYRQEIAMKGFKIP
jgi:hypothetical protein